MKAVGKIFVPHTTLYYLIGAVQSVKKSSTMWWRASGVGRISSRGKFIIWSSENKSKILRVLLKANFLSLLLYTLGIVMIDIDDEVVYITDTGF